MDQILPVGEIIGALRRRFLPFALIASIGTLMALFYAVNLPRVYETWAVIEIQNPPVAAPVSSTVESSRAMQQLQRIEQRLMSRGHLLQLIEELQPFADKPDASLNDQVYWLRMATDIEQVSNPATQWRTDVSPTAITITVRLGDPEMGARVANRLVEKAVAQNREAREARTREALEFFASEERRIGDRIATLEAELAAFKQDNADALPGALGSKRTRLEALEEADLELEKQLIELRQINPDDRRPVSQRQIEKLEEQRAAIGERRAEIRAALEAAPEVERTLNRMQRELSQLETQFDAVTRNRAEAEMGQMLEASRRAETLAVLEWAQVPEAPMAPSRKKVAVMGAGMAVMLGLALVLLLELMKPVIRTTAQMERQLGVRPSVSIPRISTPVETTRRLAGRIAVAVALAATVPFAGLLLIDGQLPEIAQKLPLIGQAR